MSWQTLALGDVCDVIGGGTPSKRCADFYEGNIPWASIRDMQGDWVESTEFSITEKAVASSATNVIPSDNVIIATRVGLGKVARLRRDTAINQDIRAVVPRDDRKLDKQYLFYWFKSIAEIIESEGKGATVKGVTLPFVKSLQLPLPSIAEQHRIVAILDEAFAGIATAKANAKKNLNNAQDLVSRLIEDLFPQDGDGSGEHSLVELCESIVDCEHRTAPTQEEGIPSIRTPNIGRGVLLLDGVNRVSEATYMEWTRRAEPKPGDLILAREAPAGNIAVIPKGCAFASVSAQFCFVLGAMCSSQPISRISCFSATAKNGYSPTLAALLFSTSM
jgi:type I restriction enzyme S subunit